MYLRLLHKKKTFILFNYLKKKVGRNQKSPITRYAVSVCIFFPNRTSIKTVTVNNNFNTLLMYSITLCSIYYLELINC